MSTGSSGETLEYMEQYPYRDRVVRSDVESSLPNNTDSDPFRKEWKNGDVYYYDNPAKNGWMGIVCVQEGTAAPNWSNGTAVSAGDVVRPSRPNGHYYTAQNDGTTGASEPTWPINGGGTVDDNGITWEESGASLEWSRFGRIETVYDSYRNHIQHTGPTGDRPIGVEPGFMYFDTDIGKPVWFNGTDWITWPDTGSGQIFDPDGDGKPDEVILDTDDVRITQDDDSINIDLDKDGEADIVIPKG